MAGGRCHCPQGLTCLPKRKMLWGIKRTAGDRGQEGAEHRRGRALRIQRLQRPMGRSHLVRDLSQLAATCHPHYALQRKGGPWGTTVPGRVLALLPVARKACPVHYHKHLQKGSSCWFCLVLGQKTRSLTVLFGLGVGQAIKAQQGQGKQCGSFIHLLQALNTEPSCLTPTDVS